MAHYSTPLSFLLYIVLFFSLQIEARESKFFTKVMHNVKESNVPLLETPAPAPAPALAPLQIEDGYGLYGRGSTEFSPTTTTTTTISNNENEIPAEQLKSESFKEYNTGDSYNYNNYNSNGYSTSSNYNNNNNNNGYTNSYYNDVYVSGQRQGLSDTRFVENGKYSYDVKNQNYYQNGYQPVRGSNNNEGYYSNSENTKYEFNSMEEYDRQEGYPESQGEYVP